MSDESDGGDIRISKTGEKYYGYGPPSPDSPGTAWRKQKLAYVEQPLSHDISKIPECVVPAPR